MSPFLGYLAVGLAALSTIGVLTMIVTGARGLYFRIFGQKMAKAEEILMREVFGQERSFSVMIPADWRNLSEDEHFHVSASSDGPNLTGSAWRFADRTSLQDFAVARFKGAEALSHFKPVGKEFFLENGAIGRHYEGIWPGERKMTSYIVVCLINGKLAANLSLMLDSRLWRKNKVFYLRMLSTLQLHPVNLPETHAHPRHEPKA